MDADVASNLFDVGTRLGRDQLLVELIAIDQHGFARRR